MNPEHQQQARRLQEYRESLRQRSERRARTARGRGRGRRAKEEGMAEVSLADNGSMMTLEPPVQDPMIYPGLYSPSGFDVLGILIRIRTRPNPTFEIGNVDSSVALVLCDSGLPDTPIVYYSESFASLTGYSGSEILGRNCRFLQHPFPLSLPPMPPQTWSKSTSPNPTSSSQTIASSDYAALSDPAIPLIPAPHPPALTKEDATTQSLNDAPRSVLREKLARGEEAQVKLVNYTKRGERFVNLLTTIPISWDKDTDGVEKRYVVGFQVNAETLFPACQEDHTMEQIM